KEEKAKELGQAGLFSMLAEHDSNSGIEKTPFPSLVAEMSDRERLDWEKELLGLFISMHPLDSFAWTRLLKSVVQTDDLMDLPHQAEARIVCTFGSIKELRTKAKNERMAVVSIEDQHGTFD